MSRWCVRNGCVLEWDVCRGCETGMVVCRDGMYVVGVMDGLCVWLRVGMACVSSWVACWNGLCVGLGCVL